MQRKEKARLQQHRIRSLRAASFRGPPTASAMSCQDTPPRALNPDGRQRQPWQPHSAAYSSALIQECGVPAPLLLNICAELADLIDVLQQLLMHCRLGAQHCVYVFQCQCRYHCSSASEMKVKASRNFILQHDLIQLLC